MTDPCQECRSYVDRRLDDHTRWAEAKFADRQLGDFVTRKELDDAAQAIRAQIIAVVTLLITAATLVITYFPRHP